MKWEGQVAEQRTRLGQVRGVGEQAQWRPLAAKGM